MGVGAAALSGLTLLGGSGTTRSASPGVPVPALSAEAEAQPAAQLLAAAASFAQTLGSKPGTLIQVPAAPLSSQTLSALQQSSQQFAVRDQSLETQIAEAPQRQLKQAIAAVTRETTVTSTTPGTTTTKTVTTPDQTVTREVTTEITVPGPESAGVTELRSILDKAEARAGAAPDRGNGRASDRYVSYLSASVERQGDRLLDSLDAIVARGGSRVERRVERTLDSSGGFLARSIDRLFDRGGDRGVSAFDDLLQKNGDRVVATLGKVLEATGDDVSKRLENLLVKAGPEAISALRDAVDRARPTTTEEVTTQETEVVPGTTSTVTTTTPGTTSTVTLTSTRAIDTTPTPAEARTEIRRQVEAYSNASNLVAPLQELATPPSPVPNPAANLEALTAGDGGSEKTGPEHGPIVLSNDGEQQAKRTDRPDKRAGGIEDVKLRPPLVIDNADAQANSGGSASAPGGLVDLAA